MSLLDVKDLRVRLDTARGPADALRGIDLSLARGETLGLIGESGCGKSMTALALMGLLPDGAQTSGSIVFDAQQLVGMSDAQMCALRGRRIGMIFQEPMTALNPLHTVGAQVAEPLRHHLGMGRAQSRAEALRLLERVRLPSAAQRLDAYPHQLSGGQRQRVMIAAALACGPDLLIADEPTTALDVTVQAEILDLMAELKRETSAAMVLITHHMCVIARLADRVCVMKDGEYVEQGGAERVFATPQSDYTRLLLDALPRLDRADRGGRPVPDPVRADAPIVVQGHD